MTPNRDLLALADKHVGSAEEIVARQQQLISKLSLGGYDTSDALSLLNSFKRSLAVFLDDRNRILKAIADGDREGWA